MASALGGLLDAPKDIIKGARGALSDLLTFDKKLDVSSASRPDFPEGFIITEYVNGQPDDINALVLIGTWAPQQPFKFGGEQKIMKEYYAGNPEAVAHILGSREKNLSIKGRFYDKTLRGNAAETLKAAKDASNTTAAQAIVNAIEGLRLRGNLLEVKLGSAYKRYGFLADTDFDLKRLADIDYTITFDLISINEPKRCFQANQSKNFPLSINRQLVNELANFQAEFSQIPAETPQSIADIINGVVSDVAGVVSAVTGFVDDTLSELEDVSKALNRALGLVGFAQAEIYRARLRLGRIALGTSLIHLSVPQRAAVASYMTNMQSGMNSLQAFLAQLRERFKALSASTPMSRYRVVNNDTLQNIAIRFYRDSTKWESIYDHNKLTSTTLVVGSILEIPRV